jgi:hypothetical protein
VKARPGPGPTAKLSPAATAAITGATLTALVRLGAK